MNIFFLSADAILAALLACDAHVIKMSLETFQIVCATLTIWRRDVRALDRRAEDALKQIRPQKGWLRHPIVLWAAACRRHLLWTLQHGVALCKEYKRRRVLDGKEQRDHACFDMLSTLLASVQDEALTIDNMPDCITSDAWLSWCVNTLNIDAAIVDKNAAKVCAANAPVGCAFGIFAADVEPSVLHDLLGDNTAELMLKDDSGDRDLVGSYRRFYAYKAKCKFAMTWAKSTSPPPELQCAFVGFAPHMAMMVAPRSSSKRKRDAFQVNVDLKSLPPIYPVHPTLPLRASNNSVNAISALPCH
jgi:hypothetical protein